MTMDERADRLKQWLEKEQTTRILVTNHLASVLDYANEDEIRAALDEIELPSHVRLEEMSYGLTIVIE